ncbi:DUF397 domain-containing protein [Planotetraspora kaengkrachanensis]|uniref:Transcriptional regulator n=1 Tax=Planotetraspora kaengkrachanensis TaxID=575193 RepID=A0A8J3PVV3_9ACTN|nr:DUF397 domain-containing protein [Planotetraspora kaengkrachanensis]GIG81903.1 transcriptional regulator [Planotetraspora kaengkrachanensis]
MSSSTLGPDWTTASRCGSSNCVEVAAFAQGTISMRDNKQKNSPVLEFSREEWRAFIAAVKTGDFERGQS